MANRNRPVQVIFRCTPEERAMIDKRMAQFGTTNMAAYLRKMAIDGYMLRLDFPELRDYVSAAQGQQQLQSDCPSRQFHGPHL